MSQLISKFTSPDNSTSALEDVWYYNIIWPWVLQVRCFFGSRDLYTMLLSILLVILKKVYLDGKESFLDSNFEMCI